MSSKIAGQQQHNMTLLSESRAVGQSSVMRHVTLCSEHESLPSGEKGTGGPCSEIPRILRLNKCLGRDSYDTFILSCTMEHYVV